MNQDPEEEMKRPFAVLLLQILNYSAANDPSSDLNIISILLCPCSEPVLDFCVVDQSTPLREGEPANETRSLT